MSNPNKVEVTYKFGYYEVSDVFDLSRDGERERMDAYVAKCEAEGKVLTISRGDWSGVERTMREAVGAVGRWND